MIRDVSTHPLLNLEQERWHLYDLLDEYIPSFSEEDAWLTYETIAKIYAFAYVLGKNAPEIAEAASNEVSEFALDMIRDWSKEVSPIGGWPEVLLRRIERCST